MCTQDKIKEQNKIKKDALTKYKKYVLEELKRLNDGYNDNCGLDISEFEPDPPITNGFTTEDLKELRRHFKNLKDLNFLLIYCNNNDIDLNQYPKIKGLCRN